MNNLAITISSLAMDLNRVAIGINRGSDKMAKRFYQEALLRKAEVQLSEVPIYIRNVLEKFSERNILDQRFAEEVFVYSILLENFVINKHKVD